MTTLAMNKLTRRNPSQQVGNSWQQSADSFTDLKLPSGSRHEPRIRLLTDVMTKRARSSLWRGSQQPNAVNAPERPCHVSGNPDNCRYGWKPGRPHMNAVAA